MTTAMVSTILIAIIVLLPFLFTTMTIITKIIMFHQGRALQVSLFMQEGIQVEGARVVLPQPVSVGLTLPVGTLTTYQPDGMLTAYQVYFCCLCT